MDMVKGLQRTEDIERREAERIVLGMETSTEGNMEKNKARNTERNTAQRNMQAVEQLFQVSSYRCHFRCFFRESPVWIWIADVEVRHLAYLLVLPVLSLRVSLFSWLPWVPLLFPLEQQPLSQRIFFFPVRVL